jgi:predicted double-glycine peptidase
MGRARVWDLRARRASAACAAAAVVIAAAASACADPAGVKRVRSMNEIRNEQLIRQQWDLSCGAAVVATLFTYQLGRPVTERQVALAMLHRTTLSLVRARLGFSLLDLKIFAASQGYGAAGYADMSLEDLDGMAPAIVPINWRGFRHFVIYRGRRDGRVLIADPAFGNRTLPEAGFAKIWSGGVGFILFDPANPHAANRMGAPVELFLAPSVQAERNRLSGG